MTPTKPLLALLLATTIAACSDNDKKVVKPVEKPVAVKPVEPAKPVTRDAFVRYDSQATNENGTYKHDFGALAAAYTEYDKITNETNEKKKSNSDVPFRDGASYTGYANFEAANDVKLDAKLKLNTVLGQRNHTVSGALSDFRNLSGREALDGTLEISKVDINRESIQTAGAATDTKDDDTFVDGGQKFSAPVKGQITGGTFGAFEFDGALGGTFRNKEEVAGATNPNAHKGTYIFGDYNANTRTTSVNGAEGNTETLGNIESGNFAAQIVNN